MSALSAAPALGVAFSLYFTAWAAWLLGVAYAGFVGLTMAEAPWRRYLALLICTRGRLPWRLGAFLSWSYELGLLRTSGIAYQSRHQ